MENRPCRFSHETARAGRWAKRYEIKKPPVVGGFFIERETRFELATPTLARLCSTTELFSQTLACFQTKDGKFTEV